MRRLREKYAIELEMAASEHVIAMTGMGDTEYNLQVFADALCDIDCCLDAADVTDPPILTAA